MSLYAIGDLHLSFGENVNKPMDVFGPVWKGYEEKLKKNWEASVKPGDTVIIPGDISWGLHLEDALADLAWVDALPGTKVLIRGNHDLWWSSMAKMRKLFPSIRFIQNDAYAGEGFVIMGSRGWTCPGAGGFTEAEDRKIYTREVMRLEMSASAALRLTEEAKERGEEPVLIGAMHFPPTNEKKQPSEFTEIFGKAGCKTVVYGHLHGEFSMFSGPFGIIDGAEYFLCSLDKLECQPKLILE